MENDNRLSEIIKGAELGYTMEELSMIMNIGTSTIRRTLRKNNYDSSWYKDVSSAARFQNLCDDVYKEMIVRDKTPEEAVKGKGLNLKKYLNYLNEKVINNLINKPQCHFCGKQHDYSYGSGIFCSNKCARSYSQSKIDKKSSIQRDEGLKKGSKIRERIINELDKLKKQESLIEFPLDIKIYIGDLELKDGKDINHQGYRTYRIGEDFDISALSEESEKKRVLKMKEFHEVSREKKIDKIKKFFFTEQMESLNCSPEELAKRIDIPLPDLLNFIKEEVKMNNIKKPKCENCREEHDYSYGTGRFCSQSCALEYSRSFITEESLDKVREGVKKGVEIQKRIRREIGKIKKNSNLSILYPISVNIYVQDLNIFSKITKEKMEYKEYMVFSKYSDLIEFEEKAKIENKNISDIGYHTVSWISKRKDNISNAEDFWIKFISSLGLKEDKDFVREYYINKATLDPDETSCYYLDFLFINYEGQKLNIEIDGSQHKKKKNLKYDKHRDSLLRKNGYIVYRIPWINPDLSEENNLIVKKQKEELINLFKKYGIL